MLGSRDKQPRSIEAWNIEGSVIGISALSRLYFLQELQGVVDQAGSCVRLAP